MNAAEPPAQEVRVEEAIRMLERELDDAVARHDRVALARILADDFVFIHSTGGLETKQEFIDNAASGNLATRRSVFELSDESIRTYAGSVAIRYGVAAVRDKASGAVVTRLRNIAVYVNVAGSWRWASGQSTRLPVRPQPVAINSAVYSNYVGRYDIDGKRVLTVTVEDGHLRGQVTGRPKLELLPRSETEFIRFSEDNDYGSVIVFVTNEQREITHAVLSSEGKELWRARRMR